MNEKIMQSDEMEIDLLELLYVLLRKWWLILAGALIGAIGMMLYTTYMVTPMYQAKSMLYLVSNVSESITSIADIQFGSVISQDFVVIAKSKPVIDGAIELLKEDYGKTFSRGQVSGGLSVANLENTRVIVFTVTKDNPEDACAIANAVMEMTSIQMALITNMDAPTVVERAEVNPSPISPNVTRNTTLGFVGGMVIICVLLVIRFMLDDRIKNEEEISRYLGVPTLANIPMITERERKKTEAKKRKKDKKETT